MRHILWMALAIAAPICCCVYPLNIFGYQVEDVREDVIILNRLPTLTSTPSGNAGDDNISSIDTNGTEPPALTNLPSPIATPIPTPETPTASPTVTLEPPTPTSTFIPSPTPTPSDMPSPTPTPTFTSIPGDDDDNNNGGGQNPPPPPPAPLVSVSFSAASYTVIEEGGPAVLLVTLTSPSTQLVTVKYTTSDGSATAGTDYTSVTGTLTFLPGQTSQTVTVPILSGLVDIEGDETATILLSEPANADLGSISEATLTIINCTLIDAITAANTDTITGGCAAGSGPDAITLAPGLTFSLTAVDNDTDGPNGLPSIVTDITIHGNSSTIERASTAPDFRIFHIAGIGTLTLNNLTISNGSDISTDGGGGLFNNSGNVTVTNSTINSNSSVGNGGGISNAKGILTVDNSTISNNSSGNFLPIGGGGGIYNSGEGTVALNASTLTGNSSNFAGGGIHSGDSGNTVTLDNTTISSNVAAYFGGIYNGSGLLNVTNNSIISGNSVSFNVGGIGTVHGTAIIINSTIINNTAGVEAGGISIFGTLTITNSIISGNSAGMRGGGIDYAGGTITIDNSTINGNTAGDEGGGLSSSSTANVGTTGDSDVFVTNSTISGNLADRGAGIYNSTDAGITIINMTIDSSTINGNLATNDGGGIFNNTVFGGNIIKVVIINSTISGNSANDNGGGIFNSVGGSTIASVRAINSTIANNSAANSGGIGNNGVGSGITLVNTIVANSPLGGDCNPGTGIIISLGYNLISDTTCGTIFTALGDITNADPMLGPLQNNGGLTDTHALLPPGNPAIDVIPNGTNGCGTSVPSDQRGEDRPQGAGCDIGAFELVP